jgi:hypothetical protein
MGRRAGWLLGLALWLGVAGMSASARAQAPEATSESELLTADVTEFTAPSGAIPFAPDVCAHYYQALRRSPSKAFLWELGLPGAGSIYDGLYANAVVTGVLTLAGTALWIAGAVTDNDALWWSGAGLFIGGRVYGLVAAPLGASLLNRAFRRVLGLQRGAPPPA